MRAIPGRLVLLGHPVRHSLSPIFQNAALRHAGITLTYEAVDVPPAELAGVAASLRAVDGAGNVTIPHKRAFAAFCARLTEDAVRAGAVNTFWCEGGEVVGDNTDIAGFETLVRSVLGASPAGAQVGLLGAGGAAAAVCAAVTRWPGGRVRLHGRTPSRAAALAQRFPDCVTVAGSAEAAVAGADLVVNATPVGLDTEAWPMPFDAIPGDAAVMDLVYRQGETAWVRAARARGHRAADGREMLLAQGAHAFERWFGVAPDLGVMRAALAA